MPVGDIHKWAVRVNLCGDAFLRKSRRHASTIEYLYSSVCMKYSIHVYWTYPQPLSIPANDVGSTTAPAFCTFFAVVRIAQNCHTYVAPPLFTVPFCSNSRGGKTSLHNPQHMYACDWAGASLEDMGETICNLSPIPIMTTFALTMKTTGDPT